MGEARFVALPRSNAPTWLSLVPILSLIAVAALLSSGVVLLSVSSPNASLGVVPAWPPNFSGYGYFFSGSAASLLDTGIVYAVVGALLAIPLGGITGYFLALKAPDWLRRIGVFLLLAAWALTFERSVGFVHFVAISPLAADFPWLAIEVGSNVTTMLVWLAVPPIGLAAYAGFRGRFFGLVWPDVGGSRQERWIHEALPRSVPAIAFGAVVAGAFFLLDPIVPSVFLFRSYQGISSYILITTALFAEVTVAAVAVVIVGLVVIAAYAGFGVILWAVRRFTTRRPARAAGSVAPDNVTLRLASFIVTGVVAGFTLISLYLPLAVAAVFSFNDANNLVTFSTFSTRWWLPPGGSTQVRSLLADPDFVSGFSNSVGFAEVASILPAFLGILGSACMPYLSRRSQFWTRAIVYFGLVAPVFLTTTIAVLRASWDSLQYAADPGVYVVFAFLPMALGLSFLVSDAALHQPSRRHAMPWPFLYLRAASASYGVAFAFILSAVNVYPGTSPTAPWVAWRYLSLRIPTPEIDAAITLLGVLTVLPLLGAFLVVHDREAFTM